MNYELMSLIQIVARNNVAGTSEAADSTNQPIDQAVLTYLDQNPSGLEFSYNNLTYILTKNTSNNKIELYRQDGNKLIKVDHDVQIGSNQTSDGFIAIEGLKGIHGRVYVGRSTENPEEIIAFAQHDGDKKTIGIDQAKSTVLFTGTSSHQSESTTDIDTAQPLTTVQTTPNSKAPQSFLRGEYVLTSQLVDGFYTSKNDGFLYGSGDVRLGRTALPAGNYEVTRDYTLFHQVVIPWLGILTGNNQPTTPELYRANADNTLYLPADLLTGKYEISGTAINHTTGPTSNVSYEFLIDQGIAIEDIDLPYIIPFLALDSRQAKSVTGSFTVEELKYKRKNSNFESKISLVVVNGSVVGQTSILGPGEYTSKEEQTVRGTTRRQIQMLQADGTWVTINLANGKPVA